MDTHYKIFRLWPTQKKRKTSLICSSLLGLTVVIAITTSNFFLLYKKVASTQEEIIFSELEKKAKILASIIDIEAYEKLLNSNESDGQKNYLKMLIPLRKAHFSIQGLRYVYTMYSSEESGKVKLFFGLDTALKTDSDKDGIIDHSDFRSEYNEDAPDALLLALNSKKVTYTRVPYSDKYGTFISVFIPLINSKGDSVGVLGVDMLYSSYMTFQQGYKNLIIKIYCICIFLIVVFAVISWQFYNKLSQSKIKEISLRNEIKEQQNFFIQESKLSEIGKMVAGITHEINNPLTIIRGLSEQGIKRLSREQMDVDSHRRNYQNIKNSSERIMEVIKNMKSIVSRPIGTSDAYYFSIHESLNNVMTAIKYKSAAENIAIKIDIDKSLLIHGNRPQIEQVFFNLISNSIDAIATSHEPWVKVYCKSDKLYVYLHFVDSGKGMSDELYKKIEQGFYTSKSNGSGMGLLICRKIIDIHYGQLSMEKDSQTHFIVKLPINEMCSIKEQQG